MADLTGLLVPIFICVVLPVAIVFIVSWVKMNGDNKRAQVILKAIESNNNIDADKLAESLRKPKKSARELLNNRLLCGCIGTLSGLALVIVGLCNFANGESFNADPVTVPMVFGAPLIAIGLSFLIVYLVTRKHVNDDDAEK